MGAAPPAAEPEQQAQSVESLLERRRQIVAMLNTVRVTLARNDELVCETDGE
jgi:hypothetical protein